MKRVMVVSAAAVVLVACGGGGDGGTKFKDPDSVQFTFGTGSAPASGSAEETAANDGATGVSNVLASETSTTQSSSSTIASLPNELMDVFDVSVPTVASLAPQTTALRASMSRRAAAYLAGDSAAAVAAMDPACVTETADTITFNCGDSQTKDGLTVTASLKGAFHHVAGHVYWDVTMSMRMSGTSSNTSVDLRISDRLSGDVTFGAGAIQGFERSDYDVSADAGGQTVAAKYTVNADLDLQYETSPSFCVDGGTLVVKLIWTEKPHGTNVPAGEFPDQAVQFTWNGCNNVTVAVGTPN